MELKVRVKIKGKAKRKAAKERGKAQSFLFYKKIWFSWRLTGFPLRLE